MIAHKMFRSIFFKSSPSRFLQYFQDIYTLHTLKTSTRSVVAPNIVLRICHRKYIAQTPNFAGSFISRNKRIRKKYKAAIDILIENNPEKIGKVASLLSCSKAQAEKFVRSDTRLITVINFEKVQGTIYLLRKAGFSADNIVKYAAIFSWKLSTLQRRLEDLQLFRKYRYSMDYAVMCRREYEKRRGMLLKETMLMGRHPTRLSYLSALLECSESELQEAIVSGCVFLRRRKLSVLSAVVNSLVHNGITKEDIVSNISILRLKPHDCKQRLKLLSQPYYGNEKKMEMFLKGRKVFYQTHRIYSLNQEALGKYKDKYHYLQERLNCNRAELELLFIKAPTMRKTSPRRFKRLLDILLNEFNFTTQTIFRNHHLLFFSETRLKQRWKILETFGLYESEKIADLILTKKKFEMKYQQTEESFEESSEESLNNKS